MNVSGRQFLLIFSICAAWALISWAAIYKYLTHGKATAAMLLGILFIGLGMRWLDRLNQQQWPISAGWFLILFVILTAAFAALYPISLKHPLNGGSDREDALHIELTAVHHHQYPYDGQTFLGNRPSLRSGTLPGRTSFGTPSFSSSRFASSVTVQPLSSSSRYLFCSRPQISATSLRAATTSPIFSMSPSLSHFSLGLLTAHSMPGFLPRFFSESRSRHASSML